MKIRIVIESKSGPEPGEWTETRRMFCDEVNVDGTEVMTWSLLQKLGYPKVSLGQQLTVPFYNMIVVLEVLQVTHHAVTVSVVRTDAVTGSVVRTESR